MIYAQPVGEPRLHGLASTTSTANPLAPARAVVDAATGAFTTAVANVRAELLPAGFQLYEEASGYWKIIQYPQGVYACNPENMRKVSFRGDVWMAAQLNLAQLYAAGKLAFTTQPLPAVGTPEREYVATLFADWYVCVMSWVSLAAFATNIQPAFLCPDNPTSPPENGLLLPTRTPGNGLPQGLDTIQREVLPMNPHFHASNPAKGLWGPMWMGYSDTGEATGWLKGEFAPTMDRAARWLQQGNGGVDQVWPNRKERTRPAGVSWATVRNNITKPWYQCYYSVLWYNFGELLADWRQNDTTGRDSVSTVWQWGPQGLRRIAEAWILWVTNQTVMDVIMASSTWYATSYLKYWDKKGLLTFSPSQAAAAQKELLKQKQAVKQQAAQQTVNAVTGAAVTVAVAVSSVPIAGPIAAGCALLVAGLTALICKRRRKKKLTVPLMQPLMLRSLSDQECNYFPPTATLEGSLKTFLDQVKTQIVDLDRAPAGMVPATGADDPLYQGIVPPASTTAPTVSAAATPVVAAGPSTTAVPIATSTSTAVPPTPVVPSPEVVAQQAAVLAQQPPVAAPPPTAGPSIPWGVIGVGGAAVAAAVFLRRR